MGLIGEETVVEAVEPTWLWLAVPSESNGPGLVSLSADQKKTNMPLLNIPGLSAWQVNRLLSAYAIVDKIDLDDSLQLVEVQ